MLTPGVSGYVGGDIVSGMYALGLDEAEGKHLFLDVGTNGEMALGGEGRLPHMCGCLRARL